MQGLTNTQLKSFDTDYINSDRWLPIKNNIDKDFPDGKFTFLDLGGGNGCFADQILLHYPESHGVVFDNSEMLLEKNKTHNHKEIILGDINEQLTLLKRKFDIVFCNWILHHLICGSSYYKTKKNILLTLLNIQNLLTHKGKVSIYENMYDGVLIDGMPSVIIFYLTSIKKISKIVHKLGSNTAGVGVCFLSYLQWCKTINRSGLKMINFSKDESWKFAYEWKLFLHAGEIYCGHFWLKK